MENLDEAGGLGSQSLQIQTEQAPVVLIARESSVSKTSPIGNTSHARAAFQNNKSPQPFWRKRHWASGKARHNACHSAAGSSISKEPQPAATTKGSEQAAAEPQTFEETVTYTTPAGSNG